MKTYFKPLPLLLLLGAAFAYLFYDGEIGINILVADGVLLVSVMGIRPQLWSWGSFRCGVVGMLISAVSLIVVNSPTGFFAHLVSFILVVGFAQSRQLRFVWYALLWGGSSLLLAGRRAWRLHESAVNESTARTPVGNWLKTAVVPLALTAPFFALYAIGSSNFLVGIEHLVEPLQVWLGNTSLP